MRWWSGTTRATGAVANPCQVATTKAAKIPMATPARLRPCRRHVVGTSGHSGLRHSLHSLYVSSNSSVGIMQAVSFWQGTRIEYSRRRCQVPSRHPPPLNEYHHWNQAYENQFRHHDMPTGTTPAGRISTNFASYMPEVIGTPWNPPPPIGDRPRIRRTWRIHARKTGPKTPSSATHQPTRRRRQLDHPKTGSKPPPSASPGTVAENGSQQADQTPPNLHHRRPTDPLAENGCYRPRNRFPGIRHRQQRQNRRRRSHMPPGRDSAPPTRGPRTRRCPHASSRSQQDGSSPQRSPYRNAHPNSDCTSGTSPPSTQA